MGIRDRIWSQKLARKIKVKGREKPRRTRRRKKTRKRKEEKEKRHYRIDATHRYRRWWCRTGSNGVFCFTINMGKIKTLLFGLLLFLAAPAAGQYTAPPTAATVQSICDDCSAHVPLGHAFTFYGETFTNSWMMANGFSMCRIPTGVGRQR